MVRLWMGGPGSGKTTRVLDELRRAEESARLVVPTATMAEHLRHALARENGRMRPDAVTTLAGWLGDLLPATRAADATALTLLAGQALEETRPGEYAALVGSPGLAGALARAMEDLANAGCDATQWAALASLGVHRMRAFETVYARVEEKLRRHGAVTRAAQLAAATRRVRELGARRRVWLDGFFQFTLGELELIRALGETGTVTVTLPEWEGAAASREALLRMGAREERLRARRAAARVDLIAAASREREVDEIALRVLEEHARGRAWREMGVLVRAAQPYVALIETTFARLGIPARAYFAPPLAGHAVGRFLSGVIEALLDGWEGEKTLAALRSAVSARPLSGAEEYELRERLPFAGLDAVRAVAPAGLAELTGWTGERCRPREWARRLGGLGRFVAAPGEGQIDGDAMRAYRMRAAALRAFGAAMDTAAEWMDDDEIPLRVFWHQARATLPWATVRAEDARRDVVHVLDVYESRQWELPVVFMCGLLEGEFPRAIAGDAVLGEETRQRLRRSGVAVRTSIEREQEEAFLFELARTRASECLTLSWPENDENGRPAPRAFVLDTLTGTPARARRLTVQATRPAPERVRAALTGEDVLAVTRVLHRTQRPTRVESFLQCPYQFFARYTLEVKTPPAWPAERLDALALGTLVHQIIADWHRGVAPMDELIARHWRAKIEELRVPLTHRLAIERLRIERGLRLYAADSRVRAGWRVEVERNVALENERVRVSGRADRVDISPTGEAVVCDFKYSGEAGVKRRIKKQAEGRLVQGGLYLAALAAEGLRPAGFYFVGVRGATGWEGSDDPVEAAALLSRAVEAAGVVAERVAGGEIRVRPADVEACGYCEFADACRVEEEIGRFEEVGQ